MSSTVMRFYGTFTEPDDLPAFLLDFIRYAPQYGGREDLQNWCGKEWDTVREEDLRDLTWVEGEYWSTNFDQMYEDEGFRFVFRHPQYGALEVYFDILDGERGFDDSIYDMEKKVWEEAVDAGYIMCSEDAVPVDKDHFYLGRSVKFDILGHTLEMKIGDCDCYKID